jgi:tight adherence protein C
MQLLARSILLVLGVALLFYGYWSVWKIHNTDRIKSYLGDQGFEDDVIKQQRILSEIRKLELDGTFINRTFGRLSETIFNYIRKITPAGIINNISHNLELAGNPGGVKASGFIGSIIIILVISFIGSFFLWGSNYFYNVIITLLALTLSFLLPFGWLQNRIRNRQYQINKDFPDAVEILSICTNAGLSFNQSMMRYSELSRSMMGREFNKVVNEIEMGLTKKEALRNMASRVDVDEVSSFVSIIIQSEELGMSISKTLSSLADQMRTERYFRVKEEVQKIPIKMMFPLAFLIFPALIAVILGPSLPPLLELLNIM